MNKELNDLLIRKYQLQEIQHSSNVMESLWSGYQNILRESVQAEIAWVNDQIDNICRDIDRESIY